MGDDRGHDQLFDVPVLLGLLWRCLLLCWTWRRGRPAPWHATPTPATPIQRPSRGPQPFPGLRHKPCCEACEHTVRSRPQAPSAPPPLLTCPRGRRRALDTPQQCCPDHECAYYGGVGRGNIRAHGHPGAGQWRQLRGVVCHPDFQETQGTPLHGTRVSPELRPWAVGALAEGLGIRAVARGFEVDPITVLHWLIEAADHAAAFSRYFLHAVTPVSGRKTCWVAPL
jgi:hypothetical protein